MALPFAVMPSPTASENKETQQHKNRIFIGIGGAAANLALLKYFYYDIYIITYLILQVPSVVACHDNDAPGERRIPTSR